MPGVALVTAAVFLGSIAPPGLRVGEAGVAGRRSHAHGCVQRCAEGEKRVSKRGRAVFRRRAYVFAIRSVARQGIFRKQYEEGLLKRNGGRTIPALTAVSRSAVCLVFSIARDQRMFTWEPPPPM